jgi:hypothetical protein
MDEANPSLQQAQVRANMSRAVMILARRRAIKEAKRPTRCERTEARELLTQRDRRDGGGDHPG